MPLKMAGLRPRVLRDWIGVSTENDVWWCVPSGSEGAARGVLESLLMLDNWGLNSGINRLLLSESSYCHSGRVHKIPGKSSSNDQGQKGEEWGGLVAISRAYMLYSKYIEREFSRPVGFI